MKAPFLFFIFFLLLFSGCAQIPFLSSGQIRQTGSGSDKPTPPPASNETQNQSAAQPAQNQANSSNSSENSGQNISSSPQAIQPQILGCENLDGNQLSKCVSDLALYSQDGSICTQIFDRDLEYKCISLSCNSGSADQAFCEKLNSADERLFCLGECNPR